MNRILYFMIFVLFLLISCDDKTKESKEVAQYLSLLKMTETPDQRVALFDVNFEYEGEKLILNGVTTTKIPLYKLKNSLTRKGIDFVNKIRVLPDTAVGDKMFAVARNSVINIRSKPKHSAELGTQGLLGMSLKVLDKQGDFYRVQTPDNYISWVDKGGITRLTMSDFYDWESASKIIFTENFGYVYRDSSFKKIISDISLGGVLKLVKEGENYYEVAYPDQRKGFVKKEHTTLYDSWIKRLHPSQKNIENIAQNMVGFPYLWGGTSAKGMDCSGFTKMVYLMNGFVIPRDASQQVSAGKTIDENLNFSDLQKGDLLFFGKKATPEKKKRVTHVGIWLGNDKQEFIHASGNVHVSSMDENQPNFDAFNKNRYLGSKRYLGVKDEMIIDLKEKLKL